MATTQQKSEEARDISLALEESFAEVIDFGPEEDSEESPEEEAIRHFNTSIQEHLNDCGDVFVSADESLPDPPSGFKDYAAVKEEKRRDPSADRSLVSETASDFISSADQLKVEKNISKEEVKPVKSVTDNFDNLSIQSDDSLELSLESEPEDPAQLQRDLSPKRPSSSYEVQPPAKKPISFSERTSPEAVRRAFAGRNMKFSINSYEEREAKEASYTKKLGRKDSTASSKCQPGSLLMFHEDENKVDEITRARTLDTRILRNAAERGKGRQKPPQAPPKFSSSKEYATLATIPRHSYVLTKEDLEKPKLEAKPQKSNFIARKTSFQAQKVVPNDDLVKNQARKYGTVLNASRQSNGSEPRSLSLVVHDDDSQGLLPAGRSPITGSGRKFFFVFPARYFERNPLQ